jgi:hypothetical protein
LEGVRCIVCRKPERSPQDTPHRVGEPLDARLPGPRVARQDAGKEVLVVLNRGRSPFPATRSFVTLVHTVLLSGRASAVSGKVMR